MYPARSKDGTLIFYETRGEGPPVILVEGAMCNRTMSRLADLLAARFTVCCYDRRGRGESGDTLPYNVQREIEDIEALIDELGAAYVYGISSGACLAIKAAAFLGDKIRKLSIYEPPYTFGDEARQAAETYTRTLHERLSQNRRGDAVELFMRTVGVPAEAIAGMRQSPMWAASEALAPTLAYDNAIMGDGSIPEDEAITVQVPALVIDGGGSPPFMHKAADEIAKVLPAAQRCTLEEQTHDVEAAVLAPILSEFFGRE